MPNKDDMRWFKQNFHEKINAAVQGTPFTLDMLTALACQETGEVWPILRKKNLSLDQVVELCVGDTFDASSADPRTAFPATKAELLAKPNGQQMFDIARQALVDMAHHIPGYQKTLGNPNKFCHGFGIFQYDLQFFTKDPDYFLLKRYADFDACTGKALGELRSAAQGIGFGNKTSLTDMEMAYVAIAYNTGAGNFKLSKGLKQGHKDGNTYYGEQFFRYLTDSKTVHVDGDPPVTGANYQVTSSVLNLRSAALIDGTNDNVQTKLPNGHIVRAISDQVVNGFREVETDFDGKHFKGFASAQFLKLV